MAYPYGPGAGMYAPPPPGLFGSTMGATTSANPGYAQNQMQTGAHLAGSGAAGFASGMGTGAFTGIMGLSTISGLGAAGAMQNAGGGFAGAGLARRAGYGVLKGAEMLDPTSYVMNAGGAGMRTGFAAGQRTFGTAAASRIAGGAMPAMQRAFASGGMRAGMGMAARFAGAGAIGGAGAMMGAAAPLAAAYGAYKGLEYGGKKMYQGSTDIMQGQALMNQMGPSIAPGKSMRGEGASTGRMMRDMSQEMGVGMEDIGRVAKQLSTQKVFQTTRSAKEFRDKFKKVMGAVKEIAKITQSSVDDAAKMFTDLRQQGFHTTADIKSQAASRKAREMTTGISAGVQSAIGGAGAQMGRQHGMRGRYGARMAEQAVAGVAMGVRSGRMSEEEVMEQGGVERVGLRMAQKQMSFMKSSRGRAMIAYSMGKGGGPDAGRLGKLMGGTSMEDIVTGAAGRGLGTLRAAGGREAREKFAPYAGMAMVQMAASQQKQLYGKTTKAGIIGMMGTMGMGKEEAELQLQQTMQMPQQLRAEQAAKETSAERSRYQQMRQAQSLTGRASASLERNVGRPLSSATGALHSAVAGGYSRAMEGLVGGVEYTGGDSALARDFAASGKTSSLMGEVGGAESSPIFGLSSASNRLASQYSDVTTSRKEALKQAGGDSKKIVDLGGGRFALRSKLAGAQGATRKGAKEGLSDTQTMSLRSSVSRDDYMSRLKSARGKAQDASKLSAGDRRAGKKAEFADEMAGEEFGAFFALKESKAIDDGMTFQKFMRKGTNERHELQAKAQSGLRVASAEATSDAEDVLLSAGAHKESGLLAARDIQSSRDKFQDVMGQYLGGEALASGGIFDTLKTAAGFGMNEGLAKTLTTNGKARQAFSGFMSALSRTKSDGSRSPEDEAELMGYLGQLKDSGMSESDIAAVKKLRVDNDDNKSVRDNFKKAWGKGGEGQGMLGSMALKEHANKVGGRLKDVTDRLTSGKEAVTDEGLKSKLMGLRGQLGDNLDISDKGQQKFSKDVSGMVSGMVSGGIDEEEMKTLTAFGGVGGGVVGTAIEEAMKGRGKGAANSGAALERMGAKEGLSKGLEAAASLGSEKERATAVIEALKESGALDVSKFEGGDDSKSIQGVQEKYIESNKEFVDAVSAFIGGLSKTPLGLAIGVQMGAVAAVEAAAAVAAGDSGNTGGTP